jgi:hypothetical protein
MKVINQKLSTIITKGTLEFLLIVMGVTIALWLENIAEDLKEREIENQYLIGFKTDIEKDILRLTHTIKNNTKIKDDVEKLLLGLTSNSLSKDKFPEDVGILMNYDYFAAEDFTLSSMRESGDFRLLQNIEVKRKIIELKRAYDQIEVLEGNFQKALDDEIVPMIIENVDFVKGKLVNEELLNNHRLSNIVAYIMNDLKVRIKAYKYTLKIAKEFNQVLE